MAFACQAPDCDHEFDDSVGWDEHDARDAGETPYFTRVFENPDGIGMVTDYVCSSECMRKYLDKINGVQTHE